MQREPPIKETMNETSLVADVVGPSGRANFRNSPSPTHSHSRTESQSPVRHGRLETEQNTRAKGHPRDLEIAKTTLDRQKVCPMYVRLFCRMHGHHSPADFSARHQPTDDELTVYTWRDATLGELADLIKEVNIECRRKDAVFDFQLVYADLRGKFLFKPMGRVLNGRPGRGDRRTLEDIRFMQGDFIDVAITFGTSAGIVRSPPMMMSLPVSKRPFDEGRHRTTMDRLDSRSFRGGNDRTVDRRLPPSRESITGRRR